ncbi:hypothetical protein WDW37_18635 [Bdellovibrionota bacterium FG-1]
MGKNLGEISYVPVHAKKLAHPKLLWLNLSYLHDNEIDIPQAPEARAEFETRVLDNFAWGIPSEDPPNAFLEGEREFFADRYGGGGLGFNFGAGRAAGKGKVQIKNLGRTPLVGNGMGVSHSNGKGPFEEGPREAIWGEINQDLPYGGNRVIALIDRGTITRYPDGRDHPDILIVREDAVRPAHFMRAFHGKGPWTESEESRLKDATQRLLKDFSTRSAWLDYVQRIAKQYAAAFAARIYHGATSASNFQLNGGFIDYGTETAQPGYGKLKVLDHNEPAGETEEIKRELISRFRDEVVKQTTPEVLKRIPKEQDLTKHFDEEYANALSKEFLELTGIPSVLVSKTVERPAGRRLASILKKTARQGALEAMGRFNVPHQLTDFDLNRILTRLAQLNPKDVVAVKKVLKMEIPGVSNDLLREDFATAYSNYYNEVEIEALSNGVRKTALQRFRAQAAKQLNQRRPELYRWNLIDQSEKLLAEYLRTGNRDPVWKAIDDTIRNGKRPVSGSHGVDLGPYETIIKTSTLPWEGTRIVELYDARLDRHRLRVETEVRQGAVALFGGSIHEDLMGEHRLQMKLLGENVAIEAPIIRKGKRVVVTLDLPKTSLLTPMVELSLKHSDGKRLGKGMAISVSSPPKHEENTRTGSKTSNFIGKCLRSVYEVLRTE